MKRKIDEIVSSSSSPMSSVRAYEMVDLIFVQDDSTQTFLTAPTFTHQIFSNENIHFIGDGRGRVKIYTMCSDLAQFVQVDPTIGPPDQKSLLRNLERALPDDYTLIPKTETPICTYADKRPPGRLLHSFQVGNEDFEIYLTSHVDDGSGDILRRAEKIALWFIEAADSIDFSDDRWEALFLYRVKRRSHSTNSGRDYFFGGYFTLFSFRNRK